MRWSQAAVVVHEAEARVGVLAIWQILESAVGAGYVGEARAEGHGSAMRRHEARQLDRRPVCLTDCVTGGRTLR